jgi:hypothetical protein
MSEALKPGGRVRVRIDNHPHGNLKGDKGTVLRVANLVGTRIYYYLVAMGKDGPQATAVHFNADEIEPDV